MARPYVGDRVLFVGPWNSFCGQRGEVIANAPHLMIRVDGDTHAMRFRDDEAIPLEDRETNMTGAE